jgi:lipopolysaccharide transport system ATP-binding protein
VTASIRVRDLVRTFTLSERVGRPVGLWEAMRTGEVTRNQRTIQALAGVTFSIEEGERVGVIGRNGAGKTTLLSILAGIGAPTSGAVEVTGAVHAMLTIGAVLREEATGRENIRLDAAIHDLPPELVDRRIDEIIAFSELEAFIDQPVRTYSSGMKARLAFSMGAFVDPEILIIDETLAVGDAFFVRKAERRLREIAAKGKIVVMVSHSLAAITDMCSRCIWMDKGRIVMDGDPHSVTEAYLTAVEHADVDELARKFDVADGADAGRRRGALKPVRIFQGDKPTTGTVRAMEPVLFAFEGDIPRDATGPRLDYTLVRADGRSIAARRGVAALPAGGPFRAGAAFDPFILGVGLYRLDVVLADEAGRIDVAQAVFEVVDEEGQYGGDPLLYCSPTITSRRLPGTDRR